MILDKGTESGFHCGSKEGEMPVIALVVDSVKSHANTGVEKVIKAAKGGGGGGDRRKLIR